MINSNTAPAQKIPPKFSASSSRDNFAVIANAALRDKRISYRAKGILASCLTHSKDFIFNKEWILEHGTEGRDAITAALKELRKFGYLTSKKTRDEHGRIHGEHYEFSDIAVEIAEAGPPREAPGSGQGASSGQNRTTGNQTTGNQSPGKPVVNRRPLERRPIEENKNPPVSPRRPGLELPDWLEPNREELTAWQAQRARAHPKLQRGVSKISLRGLLYAKECGVLQEFCELAAESTWQSLGFAGHREYIDKLAKDKHPKNQRNGFIAPIKYTLT